MAKEPATGSVMKSAAEVFGAARKPMWVETETELTLMRSKVNDALGHVRGRKNDNDEDAFSETMHSLDEAMVCLRTCRANLYALTEKEREILWRMRQ